MIFNLLTLFKTGVVLKLLHRVQMNPYETTNEQKKNPKLPHVQRNPQKP